ncbi:hypothetical protein RitSun_26 [Mycobacterium phage RitSun]|nr:hypothetical protein RitSun_26 [Mycobacterium phage RitSun]
MVGTPVNEIADAAIHMLPLELTEIVLAVPFPAPASRYRRKVPLAEVLLCSMLAICVIVTPPHVTLETDPPDRSQDTDTNMSAPVEAVMVKLATPEAPTEPAATVLYAAGDWLVMVG